MAAMRDDVKVGDSWVNAHALASITFGKGLMIQNKGTYPILLYVNDTQPAAGSTSGFRLAPGQVWSVDAGEPRVWLRVEAKGACQVCVQERG